MEIINTYLIKFASQRIKRFVSIVCICAVAFFLIEIVIIQYKTSRHDINEFKEIPEIDLSKIYSMVLMSVDIDDYELVTKVENALSDIAKVEGVKYCGKYAFEKMKTKTGQSIEAIYIDAALLSEITDKNYNIDVNEVIIGKNVENILLEKNVLELENGSNYIVKQVKSCDAKWFSNYGIRVGTEAVNLDNLIIIQDENFMPINILEFANSMLFVIEDNAEITNIIREIKTISSNNGVAFDIANMENRIDEYKIENKKIMHETLYAVVITTLLSFIAISSATCMDVLTRKRTYGIMYANGVSKKTIVISVICENILKIVTALILSIMSVSIYINNFNINYDRSILTMVIVGIVAVVISSILPIFILNKYEIREMLKGRE